MLRKLYYIDKHSKNTHYTFGHHTSSAIFMEEPVLVISVSDVKHLKLNQSAIG